MPNRFRLSAGLFAALLLASLGAFAAEPLFYIRDLSPFNATGFNDRGDFIGSFPGTGGGVWSRAGRFTPLLPPDDLAAGRAEAVAISNAGQIAGSWSYEDDYLLYPAALYWGGAAAPATVIASAIPGAPTAVNSIGTVVGSDGSPSGTRAWLWRGRDIESLPHLGNVAPGSRAYDINDTGTAVGWSSRQDFRPRAVRWRDGAVEDLGTLPGHESSFAYAINNAGVVVGEARKFLGSSEAFLWTEKGGMTSLGSGAASDINDSGWVIGHVLDLFGTQSDPFLWRLSAGRRNLASLVDLAGTGFADLGRAEDINSAGEILGVALHRDGTLHSYVLTPVPEPAIWLFLALGGLIIAGKLRRRTASTGS